MNTICTGRYARMLFLFLIVSITAYAQRYPGPLSPEESMKKLKVAEGFKVQLYAAEPHVFDPVGLEFDEFGNVYVVELYDYPFEVEAGKGKSRIRILKDTNGDGQIDKSVIFAENLTEATSMLPWKGGLIVTAAPDILYLKDTNGDGKADTKEVLFTGFFQNNTEAQITNLHFGPDNWIYTNNRGQSGTVSYVKKPGTPPLSVRGADFRFRLDRDEFELETGPGQFGQAIGEWGHRYFTENSIHIQQAVMPWRYVNRHSYLPTTKFATSITNHEEVMYQEIPPPYWRAERTNRRNQQYKEANMNRIEYAEDRFTGASGGTIYNGDGFPKEYYGNYFVTDVSGALVHRDVLTPGAKSPVMVASRDDKGKEKEFIYSTDTWFRPITFTVGPDGYLYLLDYYRQHIETPVSIPDDLKADMDFMAGSDMGRIYRIMPANASVKKVNTNLSKLTGAQLVGLLAHTNGWQRTTAHRLLLERQDKSVVPAVKALFASSKSAIGRLHALYVLEGLNALNAQIVKQALKDSESGVRENAIMLAERYPELLPEVAAAVNDASNRVAFQAALSLGEFKGKEVVPALAKVVEKHGSDSWFRLGVLSSDAGSSTDLLKSLSQSSFFQKEEPWKLSFIEDLSYVIGARNAKDQVKSYFAVVSQPGLAKNNWQLSAVKGLSKGLNKASNADAGLKEALKNVKTASDADVSAAIQNLKKLY